MCNMCSHYWLKMQFLKAQIILADLVPTIQMSRGSRYSWNCLFQTTAISLPFTMVWISETQLERVICWCHIVSGKFSGLQNIMWSMAAWLTLAPMQYLFNKDKGLLQIKEDNAPFAQANYLHGCWMESRNLGIPRQRGHCRWRSALLVPHSTPEASLRSSEGIHIF